MDAVEKALTQANQCGNETWRLWKYRADTNVLVLCGYHPDFDITGFLLFYSPAYVQLPQFLEEARFVIGSRAAIDTPVLASVNPLYNILIQAQGATYNIVCKQVVFQAARQLKQSQ